jgi:hypothetical protein
MHKLGARVCIELGPSETAVCGFCFYNLDCLRFSSKPSILEVFYRSLLVNSTHSHNEFRGEGLKVTLSLSWKWIQRRIGRELEEGGKDMDMKLRCASI